MNTLLISVVGVIAGMLAILLALALWSRFGQAPGLLEGRLSPCPGTPNCVSSEAATDAAHAVAPFPLPAQGEVMATLRAAVAAEGGEVVVAQGDYWPRGFVRRCSALWTTWNCVSIMWHR